MRFFMKAIVVLAGVTALFASSAEAASFFDATASRSHVSNIRNHIESNHNALVSGIRALGSGLFHSEALSDCIAVNVPQLRSGNIDKVKACLSISGSATFDQSCAADLTGASCSLAISLASNAWIASGDTGIPTGIPGFPPTGLPGGNDNSNPGSGSGSGPSSQCISALSDYSTAVFTKCASALSKLGGVVIPTGSPAGSPPPIDAIISAQCSVMSSTEFGDCKAAISATANVQTACPDFGIGEIKSKISANILSAIDGPMAALCVKDDVDASKYCLAAVMPSFAALGDKDFDPSKATDSVLAGICKPCVKSIVNKIAAFGGKFGGSLSEMAESLRFFNVLCAKDPTNPSKYCINVFASISALAAKASKSTSPSDVPTDSDFAPICSPCLKALIVQTSSLKAFDAEETQTLIALEKACNKDQTGKYCGPAIYSAVPSMFLSLSGKCTAGSTTCSVECKAAVQTIYDTQCCTVTIGFQGIIGAISQSPASAAVIPTLRAAAVCAEQITTATTCPVNIARVPVDLSLPNIAFTATSKNFTASLALKIALQKDLALALGVDASAIIVGDFVADNANKGGVKVSITISVDASFKASYVSTLNQQMQQQGGLPLANTAQAAEQNNAALVQGEPMTASGQGPTSEAVKNGASILSITTAIIVAFLSRL